MSAPTVQRPLRSKRYKAVIACTTCRRRKVKCDGVRPACGRCQRTAQARGTCTYVPVTSTTSTESVHPTARLESTNPPAAGAAGVSKTGLLDGDVHSNAEPSGFAPRIKYKIYNRMGLPSPKRACPVPLTNAPLFGELSLPRRGTSGGEDTGRILPPRKDADYLVNLYWEYIHPLSPVLDYDAFTHLYQAHFTGSKVHSDEMFTNLLAIVFALATQLQESVPAEHRNNASTGFFLRAWQALPLDRILWQESLEAIQCLLLMVQYLRCTRNLHQTWMALGSAVQISQSLGLDKFASNNRGENRFLLQAIWQQCMLMEQDLYYSLGRSSTTSLAPSPPVNCRRADSPDLGAEIHELVEIQRYIIVLHSPAGNLTDTLGLVSRPPLDFTAVVTLDERLDKLDKSVSTTVEPSGRNNQELLIRLRIAHSRVLLHRPMLAQFCLARVDDSAPSGASGLGLRDKILQTFAMHCIDHVSTIITLFQTVSAGALPWWYRVFYLHMSMQHLIAAILRPDVCKNTITPLWDTADNLLSGHQHLGVPVQRCLASLRGMWEKALDIRQDGPRCQPQNEFDVEFQDLLQHLGFHSGSPGLAIGEGTWLNDFDFLM